MVEPTSACNSHSFCCSRPFGRILWCAFMTHPVHVLQLSSEEMVVEEAFAYVLSFVSVVFKLLPL